MDSLMYSLQEAMYYEPDEIFIYPLYIKPNTILDIKHEKASDKRYEFYRFIADFLCRNDVKLYDEYGEQVSIDDFWILVDSKKDGYDNISYYNI